MVATPLLVLLFASLALGFNSVLVVVLDDNAYLPALQFRGVVREFNHASLKEPIVNYLSNSSVSWKVFTDNGGCSNTIEVEEYPFLIAPETLKSDCTSFGSHLDLLREFPSRNNPTFGFYFPSSSEASDPSWLRRFIDARIFDEYFMKTTMMVILSKNQTQASVSSLIFLGNDIVNYFNSSHPMLDLMQANGFVLTETPIQPNKGPWFERIFIVILENQPLKHALENKNFRNLMVRGTLLTNYDAIVNPSQPNYIALVAGDLMNVTNDDDYNITGRFVVDSFEEEGISWKGYMEDYPGNCFYKSQTTDKVYRRKHNPFMSFNQVRNNPSLCSKIVNSNQLYEDVAANDLPRYSFYTPNMNNNGHDTGVAYAGRWLQYFLTPLLTNNSFMDKTLVVVTYDEGIKPDNKIYTLLIGDMIPVQSLDDTHYTHYSLLRLVEDHFSLPLLGRSDATAPQIDPSHFYPGTINMPNHHFLLIVCAITISSVMCVTGALVYYFRVVRPRRQAANVGMDEMNAFLLTKDDQEDDLDGADFRDE